MYYVFLAALGDALGVCAEMHYLVDFLHPKQVLIWFGFRVELGFGV